MGLNRQLANLPDAITTDTSNNVGIGAAANASYKLQVTGTTNLTGALSGTSATFSAEVTSSGSQGRFGGWATGAGYQGNALEAGVSGGTATLLGFNRTSGAYIPLVIGGNTNQTTTIGGNTIVLQNNGVTALSIASTGAATFSNTTSGNALRLSTSYASGRALNFGFSDGSVLPTAAFYIGNQTGVGVFIGDETTTNGLYVKSNGNVGIGTSTVNSKLVVVDNNEPNVTGNITSGTQFAASIANGWASLNVGAYDNGSTIRYGYLRTAFSDAAQVGADMRFYTGPTERMRITSGGQIQLGTTSVSGEVVKVTGTSGLDNYISVYAGSIQVFLDADSTNSSGIVGTQSSHNFKLRSAGINRMNIDTSGNIGAPNSGTNIYNASDFRLKKNITTITNGLDKIIALNPVKFNWINGFVESEEGKDMLGFIAQEVQNAIPEAVEDFSSNSITIGETTINNPLRVNEKFIIPVLVKAIQEQNQLIQELSQQNQELNDRLDKAGL